ncbi:SDR family oxidoreductase [Sediminicola arcticus]|jgi:dehydrogenase/reductase SDR family protein 7|uniref:SDR family oxidoreductase n=1 Tax=Sediminicola arcticus TaxID=1574308 RepID=A0ABV2STG3_9FLAO
MKRIGDKIIWITGASSGIGEALSYQLSKLGCKLVISARNQEQLLKVKNKCNYPERIHILPLDLADYKNMEEKVQQAISDVGRIDMLINNAGISQRSLIMDTDIDVYKKLMDINYLGTVALTKAILPHFIAQGNGHFVTVTSLMGKFGSPYRSGYCGAKHALHGFFDVLRMEHEKDGIQVTLICPGFVNTKVAINALTGNGKSQLSNDLATEKGLDPVIFAKKMIHAITNQKFEANIGRWEVAGVYLKRFIPKLLHTVVLKSKVR